VIARPHSILLDAEALSALARGERRMQTWAEVARRTDSPMYGSTATLAEVTDGGPKDAQVRRATKAIRLIDVTDDIGYRAGALRSKVAAGRRKPRDLTVDALVAATAVGLTAPVVVLTSDPAHFDLLPDGTDVKAVAI
jgi:predicted nucleic acid-binding protein